MRAVSWNLSFILSIFKDFSVSNSDSLLCFNCVFFGKHCSCISGCLRAPGVLITDREDTDPKKNNAVRHGEERLCHLPCNPSLVSQLLDASSVFISQ